MVKKTDIELLSCNKPTLLQESARDPPFVFLWKACKFTAGCSTQQTISIMSDSTDHVGAISLAVD